MDFTLRKYRELLECLTQLNIPVFTIQEWISSPKQKGVIMRHDVDRLPGNALRMANMESQMGIKSTYYFRIGAHTFKPSIIREIHHLGHEIGYHYEDLSSAKGHQKQAITLFQKHLEQLREVAPIRTIAMHGQPLSPHDNRELWQHHSWESFNLSGEAFLSIDYSDVFYFTDTGRSWANQSVNLRDKVRSDQSFNVNSTSELINFFRNNPDSKTALVVHPERWNDNVVMWTGYYGFDQIVNFIKRGLRFVRG